MQESKKKNGKDTTYLEKDNNNNNIYDIRKVTDTEYINIATHEFGHIMGIADGYKFTRKVSNLCSWSHLDDLDIMTTDNYAKKVMELGLKRAG